MTERAPSGTEDTLQPASPLDGPGVPPIRPESRLQPGERVDHYEVTHFVGAGGMGVVYRAHDRRLGRQVALKLLRGPAPGTDVCGLMCSLLLREAQTMARLSHPALVAVHGIGEFRGCVYVAMEYIDGVTLRQWAGAAPRPWRERLDVLLQAGRGLVAAHGAQIIHRDFKPDNVLVAHDGRVVVSDFGLARSLADMEEGARTVDACGCKPGVPAALPSGSLVGTPYYMSPEQHEGAIADARSDQYGFAATVWEILHDRVPFPGRSIAEIRAAIQAQAPVAPADAGIPTAVADVLRRALRTSPSTRYPSLAQLLSRLADAAGAPPSGV